MDHELIDLTDQEAAEIAAKYDTTVEEVRRQYEVTKAKGVDLVQAELDVRMAEVEQTALEVADDVAARYLDRPDRHRAMAEFYRDGWNALSVEEITTASVGDLFLNMAVVSFLLAEARQQLATVMDGQHRRGS